MCSEPGEQGCFIDGERLGVVEMAAGFLLRGAAGVEDMGAFIGGQAGDLVFLEGGGGQRRDFTPVLDATDFSFCTQFGVNGNGVGLQVEKRGGETVEFGVGLIGGRVALLDLRDEDAQLRRKFVE